MEASNRKEKVRKRERGGEEEGGRERQRERI